MAYIAETFEKEYNETIKVLDEWLEKNIPNLKDRKTIREKIVEKLLRK
jgi:cell pole-organizing protein PopZ